MDAHQPNTLTDIRQRDLAPGNSNISGKLMRQALRKSFPQDTSGQFRDQNGFRTNGLDCTAQLCRSIFGRHEQWGINRPSEAEEDEKKNPILSLAWSSFDLPAGEAELDELAARKQRILEQLISTGDITKNQVDAKSLIESSIMNETFWSQHDTKLWGKIIRRQGPGKEWYLAPQPCRLVQGKRSLLTFAPKDPSHTLQNFIEIQLGRRVLSDGSSEMWMMSQPGLVRVQYEASSAAPADFEQLKRFQIPAYDWHTAVEFANSYDTLEPCDFSWTYELGAVVKFATSPSGKSFIRVYAPDGTHVPVDSDCSQINNNTWRLNGATSGSYLLIYHETRGCLSDVYPEVQEANNDPYAEFNLRALQEISEVLFPTSKTNVEGNVANDGSQSQPLLDDIDD